MPQLQGQQTEEAKVVLLLVPWRQASQLAPYVHVHHPQQVVGVCSSSRDFAARCSRLHACNTVLQLPAAPTEHHWSPCYIAAMAPGCCHRATQYLQTHILASCMCCLCYISCVNQVSSICLTFTCITISLREIRLESSPARSIDSSVQFKLRFC